MRFIKSPREIALMREVTRITGVGIMEAMREAAPGQFEYELTAASEWVFRRLQLAGARLLSAVGHGPEHRLSHYHRGLRKLQDGDIVQFDYAPDYKYYTSDISRVFPANGKFTARQREFYEIYLRLYQALMASITPRRHDHAGGQRRRCEDGRHHRRLQVHRSEDQGGRTKFAAQYQTGKPRNGLGHGLGMEVHDVTVRRDSFQPGELFTIEPAISIPDENLAMRIEDVILITEKGFENLSAFVPIEIADIEKLMREPGLGEQAGIDRSAAHHSKSRYGHKPVVG